MQLHFIGLELWYFGLGLAVLIHVCCGLYYVSSVLNAAMPSGGCDFVYYPLDHDHPHNHEPALHNPVTETAQWRLGTRRCSVTKPSFSYGCHSMACSFSALLITSSFPR